MLNSKSLNALKATARQHKVADRNGLYVLVRTNGARLWQYRYRFGGKEKVYSYGQYPDVSLAEARESHDAVRKLVRDGIDPLAEKQAAKARLVSKHEHTFKGVTEAWWKRESKGWMPSYGDRVWRNIESDLFPDLGKIPVVDIDTPALLAVVKKIEKRGAIDVASRAQQRITSILQYAVQHGLIKHNPGHNLRGVIKKPETVHRGAVHISETGELVRRINGYVEVCGGELLTQLALQLTLLTFLRSTEIRGARWAEFDFNKREWIVPGIRNLKEKNGGMKSRKEHIVPLSRQAIDVLNAIKELDLSNFLVFPIQSGSKRIMSENTMNHALNRLGYKGRQTVHGLRTVATTNLTKGDSRNKWAKEVIGRQMAHSPKSDDATHDAYQRYEFIEERTQMIQWYANHLDMLAAEAEGKIVRLKRA
jgi:integrase